MKRMFLAVIAAGSLATGFGLTNTSVHSQNPTVNCQVCRVTFNTCMQSARTPAAVAACQDAAQACLTANGCSAP